MRASRAPSLPWLTADLKCDTLPIYIPCSSIPGLEDLAAATPPPPAAAPAAEAAPAVGPAADPTAGPAGPPDGAAQPAWTGDMGAGGESGAIVVAAEQAVVPSNMRPAKDHPRFRKFFKMLGMRIPLPACQQKMSVELPDEDTSILERPDELVELLEDEEDE